MFVLDHFLWGKPFILLLKRTSQYYSIVQKLSGHADNLQYLQNVQILSASRWGTKQNISESALHQGQGVVKVDVE